MKTTVIGIDPGTKCGWAVCSDGQVVLAGRYDLANKRHEGAGMRGVKFRASLSALLISQRSSDPSHQLIVCYEEVRRHAGTSAAHVYGGLIQVLQMLCEDLKVPYQGIPVGTVKKFATGKGNAGKDLMIAAAKKKFPAAVEIAGKEFDDNVADAMWIAANGYDQFSS